ncbi:MAG: ArnT family glycosyltransferase [Chloroflexota bacterium]
MTRSSVGRQRLAQAESPRAIGAHLVILVVIIGISIGIRVTNILAFEPFGDEIRWMHWANDLFRLDKPDTYWIPLREEGRPPLFYWLQIVLKDIQPNMFVGGRFAAAIPCGAVAGILYLIGSDLWSKPAGIAAGLLWAISPMSVMFGRLASSDDAVLAFCVGLVLWLSVRLARKPSLVRGILCGGAIGLAVLTKTTGLISAGIPLAIILALGAPSERRKLLLSGIGLALGVAVVTAPLIPWVPRLVSKVRVHTSSTDIDRVSRLQLNLDDAREYYGSYLGVPTLGLAVLGTVVGLVRRDRNTVAITLAYLVGMAPALLFVSTFYSRYLLSVSLPLYLLAASAIGWIIQVVSIWSSSRGFAVRLAAPVSGACIALVVTALMGREIAFTSSLLTRPSVDWFPEVDQWRYFRHRWTLAGLSNVSHYLEEQAKRGPIGVAEPREEPYYRYNLPTTALRLALRGNENIQFTSVPDMRAAGAERAYQRLAASSQPIFIIMNEINPAVADPDDPRTRADQRIRELMPSARIVQLTEGREKDYALVIYQIDLGSLARQPRAALDDSHWPHS